MQIRRPLAAVLTALALFGGGASLTACGDPAGLDRNDGTSDDSENTGGSDPGSEEEGNVPDNSNPEQDQDDLDEDTNPPD